MLGDVFCWVIFISLSCLVVELCIVPEPFE
jgi:hypothetical protein